MTIRVLSEHIGSPDAVFWGIISAQYPAGDLRRTVEIRLIHVPANRVSQIIAGKRDITADTALRLGRWFGTGPQLWLNLQQAYDLDCARIEIGATLESIEPRKLTAVNA